MDSIKVLEEIGLKKISDETHIEVKYLKYMVDMQYDKLNRINTLGFIKILSREYNLDLSQWVADFEEYWQENRKDGQEDGLFIVVENKGGGKKLLYFILLVIVLVLGSFAYSVFKDSLPFGSVAQDDKTTSYYSSQSVEETKETLFALQEEKKEVEPVGVPVMNEANTTESNESSMTYQEADFNGSTQLENQDTNSEIAIEPQESNRSTVVVQESNVSELTQNEVVVQDESNEQRFEQEALIKPNSELWIGVIYLDTFKRRSYLGEDIYALDLSREQIITTGHGSFDVQVGDTNQSYNRQTPIRFLVRDGNVNEISWDTFKMLNKGNAW